MARSKRVPESAQAVTVEELPVVGARRLITIEPESPAWTDFDSWSDFPAGAKSEFVDAIVRLRPPAEATDADVARVADLVRGLAEVVRVLPRRRVIGHRGTKPSNASVRAPHARIREVVGEVVGEMTVDAEPLRAFVEGVMGRCGL